MSVALSVYAYPWDLVDDPSAVDLLRVLDVDRVMVAAAYHSVRAATPRHPRHRIVDARWAAIYPPFRPGAFAKLPIAPRSPGDWVASNAFGTAKGTLEDAGMVVGGWLALAHVDVETDTTDFRVVNAFGDLYRYALCPSHDAVVEYSAAVVRETVDRGELSSIAIEAWSQLGMTHASAHDKTSSADWSDADVQLLSICFCPGCAQLYTAMGGDGHALREDVKQAVGTPRAGTVRDASAEIVLGARAVGRRRMLSAILPAARDAGAKEIELHADDDLWGTGPSGPVIQEDGASTLIAPAWRVDAESIDRVRRLNRIHPFVGGYVSILGDETSEDLASQWSTLVSAGASSLHLYHFGLVSEDRIATAAAARRLFRTADSAF
jgi:hypothetical protein